jgi:hypothetical protein
MQNVKTTVKGTKLTIEIDLSQDFGPSTSGKTNIIATTSGFTSIEGAPGVSLGLNVVRKGKAAQKGA